MRAALLLTALFATTPALAGSLAMTDRAGGLPQCELELGEAYDAVETTIAERDAALAASEIRTVVETIDAVTMLRIRRRPDLLLQEWDQLADESIELLRQNPLALPSGFEDHLEAALIRIRKRPDPLVAEWDEVLDEQLTQLQENPLAVGSTTEDNALFDMDSDILGEL